MNVQGERSNIIFDFDGTLIDSAPGILAAFAATLREADISPCITLDASLIGPPLAEALMRISGSSDASHIQALIEIFKRHYDDAGIQATAAYPGIEDRLDHIAVSGATLHISTNKRLSVTLAILECLGWQNRFASVYALDMVVPRMANKSRLLSKQLSELRLKPEHTCYVGDRTEDGEAAEHNGLSFYFASWGYGDLDPTCLRRGWHWLNEPGDLIPFRGMPRSPLRMDDGA